MSSAHPLQRAAGPGPDRSVPDRLPHRRAHQARAQSWLRNDHYRAAKSSCSLAREGALVRLCVPVREDESVANNCRWYEPILFRHEATSSFGDLRPRAVEEIVEDHQRPFTRARGGDVEIVFGDLRAVSAVDREEAHRPNRLLN